MADKFVGTNYTQAYEKNLIYAVANNVVSMIVTDHVFPAVEFANKYTMLSYDYKFTNTHYAMS